MSARLKKSAHHGIVSLLPAINFLCRTDIEFNSKPFRSTYYDDRMRASPALLRARAPYLIKNTITGFAICSLVIGICTSALLALSYKY